MFLGAYEKDFENVLDLMLWLLNVTLCKINLRLLEVRESSFARWRDERGVSTDTRPLVTNLVI